LDLSDLSVLAYAPADPNIQIAQLEMTRGIDTRLAKYRHITHQGSMSANALFYISHGFRRTICPRLPQKIEGGT